MEQVKRRSSLHSRSLIIHTYAHFTIDFACFYILFSTVYAGVNSIQQLAVWFLTYNIIAFGLQFAVGYICDKYRTFPAAIIGIIITAVGLSFAHQIYTALILVALGNAFFHVGGGIDSLVNARGKMSRSGVFVSSGAWGVALGTLAGKSGISIIYPFALLLVAGVLVYLYCMPREINLKKSQFNVKSKNTGTGIAVTLIFISITIRAFTGFSVPIEWKSTVFLILTATFASFFGKFIGGFIGDKIGARITGVSALIISAPLLVFFNDNIVLCLLGIMLFNMTMPITLCAISNYLEGFEGLAFGITTLALLCGTFVTYVYILPQEITKHVIIVSIIISACCIFFATNSMHNKKYEGESR